MPKKFFIGLAAVALAIVLSGCGIQNVNPQQAAKEPIKIGVLLPLTGSSAYWGIEAKKGMDMALGEVNIKGEAIKIIYEDTQSKVDVAVTAAQKLINMDKVNVIYSNFSGVSLAVSPIAKNSETPLFYGAFTQTPLQDNPLSFKGFLSFDQPCEKYAKQLKDKGIKKIAVLNEFGDAYQFCKAGLKKYFSDNDIEVTETLTGADFRTLLLKLKNNKTEAIVMMTYENNSINIFKQIKELNLHFGSLFCEQNDCYTANVKTKAGYVPNLIYFDPIVKEEFKQKVAGKYEGIDKAKMTPLSFGYEDVMRIYKASLECQNMDKFCFVSSLSNGKESAVFEDAPVTNRAYYPKLQFIKVNPDGSESEISL